MLSAQVLRYSALGLGVVYGFYHQRQITVAQRATAAKREYEHKQQLIEQAKAAYSKSKQPASANTTGGRELQPIPAIRGAAQAANSEDPVNQDPMDPNFNLEAFFDALVKQTP